MKEPNCLLSILTGGKRKRQRTDSMKMKHCDEDETLLIKVKRLDNDVQLLKERAEIQEKQMIRLPFVFLETRMATGIIPTEEGS